MFHEAVEAQKFMEAFKFSGVEFGNNTVFYFPISLSSCYSCTTKYPACSVKGLILVTYSALLSIIRYLSEI